MNAYIILSQTFIKGNLEDDAIIPFYCTDIKVAESAIRILSSKMFEKYKSQNKKPKLNASYNSEDIAKGKIRIYFIHEGKNAYITFRPYMLKHCDNIEYARKFINEDNR